MIYPKTKIVCHYIVHDVAAIKYFLTDFLREYLTAS